MSGVVCVGTIGIVHGGLLATLLDEALARNCEFLFFFFFYNTLLSVGGQANAKPSGQGLG